MKKFTMFLSAIMLACLLIAGPAMAGYADFGSVPGQSIAGAKYDANSWFISTGSAWGKIYSPTGNSFVGSNLAGAYSSQKVKSCAAAFGLIPKRPYQTAEVWGQATQWSIAGIDLGNGNWANGGQTSWSGYYAKDTGYFLAKASGDAETIGGTLAGAYKYDDANKSVGMAGAVTGSYGYANANCDIKNTYTGGFGVVNHASYASNHGAQAWTGGSANYNYQTAGQGYASGCGYAGTFGISKVNFNPNTGHLTATAKSISFSSGGSTNANGGVHIVN